MQACIQATAWMMNLHAQIATVHCQLKLTAQPNYHALHLDGMLFKNTNRQARSCNKSVDHTFAEALLGCKACIGNSWRRELWVRVGNTGTRGSQVGVSRPLPAQTM